MTVNSAGLCKRTHDDNCPASVGAWGGKRGRAKFWGNRRAGRATAAVDPKLTSGCCSEQRINSST